MRELRDIINEYEILQGSIKRLQADLNRCHAELEASEELRSSVLEGTVKHTLPDGTRVSFARKVNRTAKAEDVDRVSNQLPIDTYFKKKYDLSIAEYRKANDADRAVLNTILTTKPAKGTVTIKRPV